MIKKISKIMWMFIGGFFIFAMIIGVSTGNNLIAELSGRLAAYAFFVQIILWIIKYYSKKKLEND